MAETPEELAKKLEAQQAMLASQQETINAMKQMLEILYQKEMKQHPEGSGVKTSAKHKSAKPK